MLEDLYQEVILDHSRRPRHAQLIEQPSCQAHGHNPMCGDELWCTIKLEQGKITELGFKSQGCAISVASASLLSEAVHNKTITEVDHLFNSFHDLVTKGIASDDLGKLNVLAGVKQFPMRVKCATLAWHTLNEALHNQEKPDV